MDDSTILKIKPENATPKGFFKFLNYFMIAIGLPTFFFGGFILVIMGVCILFIFPKNVKKNYPFSYTLTSDKLTAYGAGGQVHWSIPWSDIDSLYIIYVGGNWSWAMPKSLGLKLKEYSNFQESISRSNVGIWKWKPFSRFFSNKHVLRLSSIATKYDIIISYQFIDRSAEEFGNLLNVYIAYSKGLEQ